MEGRLHYVPRTQWQGRQGLNDDYANSKRTRGAQAALNAPRAAVKVIQEPMRSPSGQNSTSKDSNMNTGHSLRSRERLSNLAPDCRVYARP